MMPVVHNPIKTNSDLDVYPTHEAKLGKGGYRTVANIAERDKIPFERCEEGMLVTVLEDDTNNNKTTTYILKQNTRDSRTWEKFNNDGVNPDLTNRIVALETSSAKVDNEIVTLSNEISTKASLDEHNNLVASLATYALKSDLNTLATKDELNDKLDSSVYAADKVTFATKDELSNKADITNLDTLATKDELNTLVYTKSEVDEKIADVVTGGSINLDGYVKKDEIVNLATKAELNNKADRSELDTKANSSDLQNLATKDELNAKLDISTYTTDKATFATKDELNDKLDISTYTTDKATFATKDELNDKVDSSTYTTDKTTFATKDELNNKADLSSLASLATKAELSSLATKDELNNKADLSSLDDLATKTELSSLATKDELNAKLDSSTYTADKATFTTKDELNTLVYTKSQVDEKIADVVTGGSINLDGYVKKDEIVNLATKDELNDKLDSSVYAADKVTFATKDELNNKADLSSLASLATKTELNNKADRSELDTKANSSDLQNLATKTELSSLATKDELNAKLDISTYTVDKDTFATKDELNLKADLSSLDDLATKTELSSLATKDELNAKLDISTYTTDKDTFATKTQLEGKANKDEVYSKTEIDDNYTTTEKLNLALASKADKSTVDSLATKVEVNEKISKLATKEEMTSGLATKADSSIIPTLATKTELSSLATKDELNLKADLSSLDDLATKTELNKKADLSSLDDLASKTELNKKADRSELATKANSSDLQNLATKEKVNEINSTLTNTINSKANANAVVNLTGNQTIAGVKTFSSPPVSATNPTANNQVANKAYVDTVANAKANANATVNLTGNQSIAGAKTFTSNITAPNITAIQNSINTINTSLSTVVSDGFTPYLILKTAPLGFKAFSIQNGAGQDEINAIIAQAVKYRFYRLYLYGTITGNINIQTAEYADIVFDADSNAKLVGNLGLGINTTAKVTGATIQNGQLSLSRYSRAYLLSDCNITAPASKDAIAIASCSTIFTDQNSVYPVKPLNLTSDLCGISLDNSSSFIAGRGLTINTTNTTTKINLNRGSFAALTGTTLRGDGSDFNIATNTVTPNGTIAR